jgi:hypothetical protein
LNCTGRSASQSAASGPQGHDSLAPEPGRRGVQGRIPTRVTVREEAPDSISRRASEVVCRHDDGRTQKGSYGGGEGGLVRPAWTIDGHDHGAISRPCGSLPARDLYGRRSRTEGPRASWLSLRASSRVAGTRPRRKGGGPTSGRRPARGRDAERCSMPTRDLAPRPWRQLAGLRRFPAAGASRT